MKPILIILFTSLYFIYGIFGDTIAQNFFGLMTGIFAVGIFATYKN